MSSYNNLLVGGQLADILLNEKSSQSLIKAIENLRDLIFYKIKKNSIQAVFTSVRESILELRFEILKDAEILEKYFYDDLFDETIKDIYKRNPVDSELELYLVKGLEIFKKVICQYSEHLNIEENKQEIFTELASLDPKTFISIINILPTAQREDIVNGLYSSLFIDFYMIATDAYLSKEIDLEQAQIDELKSLFKINIEKFALFNYKTGLWKPFDEDETPWIRNIKILIAREQFKDSDSFSFNQMREFITE